MRWLVGVAAAAAAVVAAFPVSTDAGASGPSIGPAGTCSTIDIGVGVSAVKAPPVKGLAADDERIVVGDTVVFTVQVTNAGPASATGVTVQTALSTGLAFSEASTATGSFDPTSQLWTVGTLAAAGSATLTVRALVTAAGAISFTATISGVNETDRDDADDQATVVRTAFAPPPPSADLALDMSVDNVGPKWGSNVTFTIVVTNTGPDTATGVVVADLLPRGLTYVSADGGYDNVAAVWTLGTLASSASVTLGITARYEAEAPTTNVAIVAGDVDDPRTDNNSDSITISTALPPLFGPADTLPPDTVPPETVPPDTVPPETVPAETLPAETVPTESTEPTVIESTVIEQAPAGFVPRVQRSAAAAARLRATVVVPVCVPAAPTTSSSTTSSSAAPTTTTPATTTTGLAAVAPPPVLPGPPTTTEPTPTVAALSPVLPESSVLSQPAVQAGGQLPVTGGDTSPLGIALVALLVGVVLTLAARRRRPSL